MPIQIPVARWGAQVLNWARGRLQRYKELRAVVDRATEAAANAAPLHGDAFRSPSFRHQLLDLARRAALSRRWSTLAQDVNDAYRRLSLPSSTVPASIAKRAADASVLGQVFADEFAYGLAATEQWQAEAQGGLLLEINRQARGALQEVPAFGWEDTATRTRNWLSRGLSSPESSRAQFHQLINVADPARALRVPRPQLRASLKAALAKACERPIVVAGEDGVGKTWAVADAVSDWSERHDIVLFVPARSVTTPRLEAILSGALCEQTQAGTVEGWRARLSPWFPIDPVAADPRRMIVVVDGLNQNPAIDWPQLVYDHATPRWRDRVKLVLVTRPRGAIAAMLESAAATYERVEVAPFDDAELNTALKIIGRAELFVSQRSGSLDKLLRTPRYLEIAAKLWDELDAVDQVTPSRLLLEDMRARAASQSGLSKDDWAGLLVMFGERLVAGKNTLFSPGEVTPTIALTAVTPERIAAALEDIRSGSLFPKRGAVGLDISDAVSELALGMAVVDDLLKRQFGSQVAVQEAIDEALPDFGAEARSSALRFAAIVSLCWTFEHQSITAIRAGLLVAWLAGQNPTAAQDEEASAYAALDVGAFADAFEMCVAGVAPDRRALNVLREAIEGVARTPQGRVLVLWRAVRWAGVIGIRDSFPQQNEAGHQRRLRWLEEQLGFAPEPGVQELLGVRIEFVAGFGSDALVSLAADVLRDGPLAPHALVFKTAAVAAAIGRQDDGWSALRWTARLNAADASEADAALRSAAGAVLRDVGALAESTAKTAAFQLLELIADDADREAMEQLVNPNSLWSKIYAEYLIDPTKSAIRLEARHVLSVAEREDLAAYARVIRVKPYLANHTISFPQQFADAVVADAKARWRAADIGDGFDTSSAGVTFATLDPALARMAPETLGALKRQFADHVLTREGIPLQRGAQTARTFLAVMSDAQLTSYGERLVARQADSDPSDDDQWVNYNLYQIAVAGLDPQQRFDLATKRNGAPQEAWPLIAPLAEDDVERALLGVPSEPVNAAALWLVAAGAPALTENQRRRLEEIAFGSSDWRSAWAIAALIPCADKELVLRMIAQDWRWAPGEGDYSHYGSQILIDGGEDVAFEDILGRVAPWRLPAAVRSRGAKDSDVQLAAPVIEKVLFSASAIADETETPVNVQERAAPNAPDRLFVSLPGPAATLHDQFRYATDPARRAEVREAAVKRAMATLGNAQRAGDVFYHRRFRVDDLLPFAPHVDRWAARLLSEKGAFDRASILAPGFLLAMFGVLLRTKPALALRFWRARSQRARFARLRDAAGALDYMVTVFASPPSEERDAIALELWDIGPDATDVELFSVVFAAERAGGLELLDRLISEDAASPRSFRKARAIVAQSLRLEGTAPTPPSASERRPITWLDAVRESSARRVRANADARHWYKVFRTAPKDDEAYAAWVLMLTVVDRRYYLWPEHASEAFPSRKRRAHEIFNADEVRNAIERNERDLERQFLDQQL